MSQAYCLSLRCTLTYSCLISFALACRLQPIAHCSMHIFNALYIISLLSLKLRGQTILINLPSNFWEAILKGIMISLCIRSWNVSSSNLSNVSSKSSHLLFTLWPKYFGLDLSLLWKLFEAMRCVMHDRTCHMRMYSLTFPHSCWYRFHCGQSAEMPEPIFLNYMYNHGKIIMFCATAQLTSNLVDSCMFLESI